MLTCYKIPRCFFLHFLDMYTQTSQSILGPMAQSISELILLNTDKPFKDIRAVSKVVQESVMNLVAVGCKLESDGDELLKVDMRLALDLGN